VVQYVKVIFYKEVVLLTFFWLHFFIFFILPILLSCIFRYKNFFSKIIIELKKEYNLILSISFLNSSLLITLLYGGFFINDFYKNIKTNIDIYIIYLIIGIIVASFNTIFSLRKEIRNVLENKVLTFISNFFIFVFSSSIYLYSNRVAGLDISSITQENAALFPSAINLLSFTITSLAAIISILLLLCFSMLYHSIISLIKDSLKNMIAVLNIVLFIFYSCLLMFLYIGYLKENGVIKILQYSSYLDVNENCGFHNEKNTWLSYLGGGNISVLTLDKNGNYHFKSRPCEPKVSSSESKK